MKQSEKAQTITIRTETVLDERYTYRYILFFREELHRARRYSVRAELVDEDGAMQSKEIADAFSDPALALIFFSLCREHLVMPAHLEDIFMDFEY